MIDKKQSGSGLVGILVGVAILGIVSVTMVSMFTNLFPGQNTVKFQTQVDNFNEEIRAMLSSPTACLNSLGGTVLTPATNANIAKLKNDANAIQYTTAIPYGDRSFTIVSMSLS